MSFIPYDTHLALACCACIVNTSKKTVVIRCKGHESSTYEQIMKHGRDEDTEAKRQFPGTKEADEDKRAQYLADQKRNSKL
jgi:hypothetical protein